MASSSNLQNTHVFFTDDGIWDAVLGLALLLLGITLWAGLASYNGVIAILLYVLLLGLKRTITVPRLRPDEITPAGRLRARRFLFVAGAVVAVIMLAGLALYLLAAAENLPLWLDRWLSLYLGYTFVFLGVSFFSALGTLFQAQRLHGYAAAVLVAFIATQALQLATPAYFLMLGAIILLTGAGLVRGFARSHPRLPPGEQLSLE